MKKHFYLIIVFMFTASTLNAETLKSLVLSDNIGFNAKFYIAFNPDIKKSGYNLDNAREHWLDKGIRDGRLASPLFDIDYYLNRNPDLRNQFMNINYSAYLHWLKYGLKEGRISSSVFDPKYYLERHSDLRRAFGRDYKRASAHWLKEGIKEGRQGAASFSVQQYLLKNPDLRKKYRNDNMGAVIHWIRFGQFEERKAVR